MANINEICSKIVTDVPDSLGCAVVDLETGLLLGVAHNVPYFTQSYLDAVAAAAVDMFRGRTVTTVEELLSRNRGEEVRHMLKEIQMTTENTYHFMAIVPQKPDALMVLITSTKASLGAGWSAVRTALPDVAANTP
ncbi:MAG TPA: hypothetical protein VK973_15165 [Arenicellales bacterium]|nr:hypothetical protein [Arenicellales bacterium]